MSDARLLMLCPYWPPMGGPGVQRAVKFAKYLPEFGVSPYVLTRKDMGVEDASLVAETAPVPTRATWHIPFQKAGAASPSATASRVGLLKKVRDWIQLPDHALSWYPLAVREGVAWSREILPTALYSTSPYHSVHLAGAALQKRLDVPWIADFRDPWAGDLFTTYPTPWHRRLNARMERAVVTRADAIVVISRAMARDFQRRYPDLDKPIDVIYNGFDTADFAAPQAMPAPKAPWILRHMGTFYPDRKPDAFLLGLAALRQQRPELLAAFRVEFYGKHHPDVEARLRALLAELELTEQVHFFPYVKHSEALRLMATSHALVLIPGPGETTVTGKIFEYLAAARPILAMAPRPSGIDEIGDQLGPNPLRVEEEPSAVARALILLAEALTAGTADNLIADPARAAQFTRRSAAGQLAEIILRLRGAPLTR